MQLGYAPVLYLAAVLGLEAAMQRECTVIQALQDKLAYQRRLQYMKHNFPINYTVNVHFQEVLRPANITSLRVQHVGEPSLRFLWVSVNVQVLKKVLAVLPEKHPSWEYAQDLFHLFEHLDEEYNSYDQGNVDALVWDVVEQGLFANAGSSWKAVRPKALLDNCAKVMWLLYGALCW